jgi:hypothetical protein
LGQIVPAVVRGTLPESIELAEIPTSAVHVQDLADVLPLYALTARSDCGVDGHGGTSWRRAILLRLAAVMLLAILAMGWFSTQAEIAGTMALAPIFAVQALLSLSFTLLYQKRPADQA